MNKYLIFRTDRVGDFLLTAILIKSIKRNDVNSYIKIVASVKNSNYIQSFENINEVVELKKGLINKIRIIYKLQKDNYNSIIIHDGKNRSKFISFFLKSKNKIFVNSRILFSQINKIKKILGALNYNFEEDDLNTLNNRKYTKKINLPKKYIVLHFDEKWIYNTYIRSYQNIEPDENQLLLFLSALLNKLNKNIIVTTGINTPKILSNIFSKKINSKIELFKNLNFFDLEKVVINSDLLISCHGSISHICAAKKIKQIDIIDRSYKYSLWTEHFRNYQSIVRTKFSDLSKNILDNL
tara:strand:- start:1670 stop:2557 length:888 start_codon:yes stop_codon:yes gene_type:complete